MENEVKTVVISQSEYNELKEAITRMEALIKFYEGQLLLLKRHQYGISSEHVEIEGQISLFDDEVPPAPPEIEIEEITYKRKKQKGKREEDVSNLPVVRIDYELSETERICPECGTAMKDIGVNIRRELELIPAKVILKEHAAHTYACPNIECEEKTGKKTIVKANMPEPLISGSLASPSLVAHIAVQKYSNGMPLYRIEKGFQYDGINITRQNMANWVVKCAMNYLSVIYFLMISFLIKESVIHADDYRNHWFIETSPRKAA
jgi:transposase